MKIHEDAEHIKDKNIGFLLNYCSKHAKLYNLVANHLYERFNIRSAEISLLVTYYIAEDRRKIDD